MLTTVVSSLYCPFRNDYCAKECALLIRDGDIARCALAFTYDNLARQNEIKKKLDMIINLLHE